MTKKQGRERYYFEKFRQHYELPAGNVRFHDAPDVLIVNGEHNVLGVEITNFYIEDGLSPTSEQKQAPMREKVVAYGRNYWDRHVGRPAIVVVGFDKTCPITDIQNTGERLGQLLSSAIANAGNGELEGELWWDRTNAIPEINFIYASTHHLQYPEADEFDPNEEFEAFSERRIRRELEARKLGRYKRVTEARWRASQVYHGQRLDLDRLRQIIEAKEIKAKKYLRCEAYYLLIIVEFADRAQDVQLPADCVMESAQFERIIVFRTAFDEVLEVKGPATSSGMNRAGKVGGSKS